jgi:ribosomal protein S18 acetylase RimI-like enzyme
VEPPTPDELLAMQRNLVLLPLDEGASATADPDLGVTFVRGPGSGPDVTYAALPDWPSGAWPEALDAVREHMSGQGLWPSLLLIHDPGESEAQGRMLEGHGWMRIADETVLWVGRASVVPHLESQLRIEAVHGRSLARHQALEREIFGITTDLSEARQSALRAALESGRVRAWIVWLDQEPVAVARLAQGDGVAGLMGIGVTPARRGQGYGTLITTVATRAGMAVGNRVLWLSVREDNAPALGVYTKLGFAPAFRWTRWLASERPQRS